MECWKGGGLMKFKYVYVCCYDICTCVYIYIFSPQFLVFLLSAEESVDLELGKPV